MNLNDALQRCWLLYNDLRSMAERDPDQEVRGIALPVLDACLTAFRQYVADDAIVAAIQGVVSPEVIAEGSVRAVDALLVVGQLARAMDQAVPTHAMTSRSVEDGDFYILDESQYL